MNKPTIIFDVDGVLFEYDKWEGIDHYGKPIAENIRLCNSLYRSGDYDVCIWSTRTNPLVQGYPQEDLVKALAKQLTLNGVEYHRVLLEPKPLFYAMIDDRAVNLDYDNIVMIKKLLRNAYFNEYKEFPYL